MEKRPVQIDDALKMRVPSDPQISPDGSRIAFIVKTADVEKNRYHSHIFVVGTGELGTARQWTQGPGSESNPRWSPDGKYIAFTSKREEKNAQLYLLPTDGGEAEKVTDLPPGVIEEPVWSPDGNFIAFTFRPQDEERREDKTEERKKAKRSEPPRVITRRHFRAEGEGFLPREPFHLYVFSVADRSVTRLTDGDRDADTPCWSPDSARIAFTRNTAPDPDLAPSESELFVIPAQKPEQGYAEPDRVVTPPGPKSGLAWSPSGTHIAYLGHDRPHEVWGVSNTHPWAAALDNSGARDLAPGWDVTTGNTAIGDVNGNGASGPFWASDSESVYFLASDRGTVDVYRANLTGDGHPKRVTEGQHAVCGFGRDATGNLALLVATTADAGDVYLMPSGSPFFKRLTRLNGELFDGLNLPTPRYFEAPAPDGQTVPCWAILPPGYADDPTPRPTILYIHGGPHLMYAHVLFHEYQALAAQGYAVLYPNPRGSKGYGEAWTSAIRGNWGEPAQADCLACVDYAVGQGWADNERLGVAGGSYGGYLTGWIAGHSNRFRVAVAERGVFNLVSMAGTCDFVWRDGTNDGDAGYFRADTTANTDEYRRNSPLTYADTIHTPLLIVHSEGDLRCPIGQADEFFAALNQRGREVTYLRYGSEGNHNLSRSGPPDLRVDRQERITAFFDKHLKSDTEPTTYS